MKPGSVESVVPEIALQGSQCTRIQLSQDSRIFRRVGPEEGIEGPGKVLLGVLDLGDRILVLLHREHELRKSCRVSLVVLQAGRFQLVRILRVVVVLLGELQQLELADHELRPEVRKVGRARSHRRRALAEQDRHSDGAQLPLAPSGNLLRLDQPNLLEQSREKIGAKRVDRSDELVSSVLHDKEAEEKDQAAAVFARFGNLQAPEQDREDRWEILLEIGPILECANLFASSKIRLMHIARFYSFRLTGESSRRFRSKCRNLRGP